MPNLFRYKIHHTYQGRTKADPFATPRSSDTMDRDLSALRAMLHQSFTSTVKDQSLLVEIVTDDSQDVIDARLERPVVQLNNATSGLCFVIDKV